MTDLICRDEIDRLKPCPFCPHCHEPRQTLHHRYRIRGRECWAFVMLSDKLGIRPQEEVNK